MSHQITSVDRKSPLFGRVFPGDELLNINGRPILDVLDYEFYAYDGDITLALRQGEGIRVLRVRKAPGESLGLGFETYLMDRERSCDNSCVFCFIDQNPKGMRRSIYYKDDDARLSFLTGNYITLTNIGARELQRIIDLRISPVNISVHTTDLALRIKLLGNPGAGEVLDKMHALADGGVKMNCQIVCCPGYNDGEALEKTLRDLGNLYPAVASVSVVPVGLTRHREGLRALEPVDATKAREIIDCVDSFRESFLKAYRCGLVCCADELYLKAGLDIPSGEYYADFPQLENGVGMLRLFETQFMAAMKPFGQPRPFETFSIATGTASAPFIKNLLRVAGICDNIGCTVHAVRNDFFGPRVDVAGLVTGADIVKQLRKEPLGGRLLLPRAMLRRGSGEFLDNVTLNDLERELKVPVIAVEMNGGALFDEIFR